MNPVISIIANVMPVNSKTLFVMRQNIFNESCNEISPTKFQAKVVTSNEVIEVTGQKDVEAVLLNGWPDGNDCSGSVPVRQAGDLFAGLRHSVVTG